MENQKENKRSSEDGLFLCPTAVGFSPEDRIHLQPISRAFPFYRGELTPKELEEYHRFVELENT